MRTFLTLVLFASTSACTGAEIEDTDGATLCANLEGWEGRHVRMTERLDGDAVRHITGTLAYCPGECCNNVWYLYRLPGCEDVTLLAEEALPSFDHWPARRLVCISSECPDCPDLPVQEFTGRLLRGEDVDPSSHLTRSLEWVFVVDAEPVDAGTARD